MIRRPPRSTLSSSSAASDVYKRQDQYEVKKEDLVPYHRQALRLLDKLEMVKLEHVPRSANKMADAQANLAATLALGQKKE